MSIVVSGINDAHTYTLPPADCSSVDHENESADNTLRRSQCSVEVSFLRDTISGGNPLAFLQLAARIQVACGCARGRPCYWST